MAWKSFVAPSCHLEVVRGSHRDVMRYSAEPISRDCV